MNAKTRRAALEAAARVALGALSVTSLASCGGKTVDFSLDTESTETGPPTPSAEPVAEAGAPRPVPTPTPPRVYDAGVVNPPAVAQDAGSGLACVGPVRLSHEPQPAIADEAFGCCVAYLAAHVSADAGADPSRSNCCHAVIVGVDQDSTRYNLASTRFDCCSSNDIDEQSELWGHHLCAPWGPPVPPSLETRLFGVA